MAPWSGQFEDPRTVLKRYGLKPKRSWGQNFLVSERALRTISEKCVDTSGRRVIEIGAGLGTLTTALLDMGARVTAVERDRELCEVLRVEFGEHPGFELAEADAKTFDYTACLGGELGVVVGNLPYQLTGQLLRVVMEIGPALVRAVLMVQEEVANRLVAAPGDKARGALSAIIQARHRTKSILRLAPTAFHPRPKVRSCVIQLEPRANTVLGEQLTPASFDRVVKAAFSNRRKTLRNSLVSGGLGSAREIDEILHCAGVDPQIRPARVTEDSFARITKFLDKSGKILAVSRG